VTIKLYSYWRSSAAYRVRIALNLKGLDHEIIPVSLLPGVAEHRQDAYRERNPQMLVPFLKDGDIATGQSLAILEYLEETYPEPALLPTDTQQRAAVRSFCNSICCDIHPLNNLRVMQYLKGDLGGGNRCGRICRCRTVRIRQVRIVSRHLPGTTGLQRSPLQGTARRFPKTHRNNRCLQRTRRFCPSST